MKKLYPACEAAFDLLYNWFDKEAPDGLSLLAHELTEANTEFITRFIEEGCYETVFKCKELVNKECGHPSLWEK